MHAAHARLAATIARPLRRSVRSTVPEASMHPRPHRWLTGVLLALACLVPPAFAAPPVSAVPLATARQPAEPPEPGQEWPRLFAAVQEAWLFEDQKFLADAVPRRDPAQLEAAFLAARARPGFDLRRFVEGNFLLPSELAPTPVRQGLPLRAHIEALWPLLTRRSPEPAPHDSLLQLPHPYVVPGGRFREVYYWDSYFTMLGLAESGQHALVRQMLDNFAHLVDTWGHIPNGNRSYYLSRSQPPFFSHMVMLQARQDPAAPVHYLPQLRR